jgi:dTDP-4-dehydrorhamnose 3,5-epimerase
MPFEFTRLEIPEVVLVTPKVFPDGRGFFMETYKYSDFSRFGIPERFVQDNVSRSTKGVLRGLHYQKDPKAQGKFVRCVRGAVFDVAVDIRRGSPAFGKWVAAELTEENRLMLYMPAGFAHGFVVTSDLAEIEYKCTEEYSAAEERGIRWDDPEICIEWPDKSPSLSDKDRKAPLLRDAEINFRYHQLKSKW